MRSKSTRNPLREVTISKTASNRPNNHKKSSAGDPGKGEDSVDGLILLHSQVSSMLRQIDEIVVEAIQTRGNHGRDKLKELSGFLSDMEVSLKPWIAKLEKALKSHPTVPEHNVDQALGRTGTCVMNGDTGKAIESPKVTKQKSLVSPSPLVSWRAECNMEHGRQLFLLTPLPQKNGLSSKSKAPSLCLLEKICLDEDMEMVSTNDSVRVTDEHNEDDLAHHNPDRGSESGVTKAVEGINGSSPDKYQKNGSSLFAMSPLLKMSPPKSCAVLEPVSDSSGKKNKATYKCTPFPSEIRVSPELLDTESELTMRYPQLFGMKMDDSGGGMDSNKDSLNWILSPPKTCVVMQPPDEKSLANPSRASLMIPKPPTNGCSYTDTSNRIDLAESTPIVKDRMSSYHTGKQHPGENTLKKELWTKFEAASPHIICFKDPVLQPTAPKGFLDRLDEVSET